MARSVARRRLAGAPLPEWIRPQLTQLVDQAPNGPDWLHEIKFDGYRMHARLDRGAVRLLTRTRLDWTHKYTAIAAAVSSIGAPQAYLDGELCGVGPSSRLRDVPTPSKALTGCDWPLPCALFRQRVDGLQTARALDRPAGRGSGGLVAARYLPLPQYRSPASDHEISHFFDGSTLRISEDGRDRTGRSWELWNSKDRPPSGKLD